MRQQAETDIRAMVAEKVRLIHKELGWAVKNLASIYDMIRTEENPPIEDPNQLKLFTEKNNTADL